MEICKCKLCGKFPIVRLVTRWEKPSIDDYWQAGCNHDDNAIFVMSSTKGQVISVWNGLHSIQTNSVD